MPTTLNATILLLVSPAILRVVIQETLQHEGYAVYPAGDLGTAVDKLKELEGSKPDLLIVSPYAVSYTHLSSPAHCNFSLFASWEQSSSPSL